MGVGDRDLKRKVHGSASKRHGMLKTKKKQACVSKGCGILKAKEEALAAVRLLHFKRVPGGMDIWMDHWREMKAKAAAEEAASPMMKKRKRVVQQRLPKALINLMVARPFRSIEDLTSAQLAKRSREFRKLYAFTTFADAKLRDYEQTSSGSTYDAQGYAEDESDVTDDEEDATVDEK
ncbi:uncharacterized protein [Miscanthus floridulus]|uniref:uncharacterized protein n=1 Tax=Miscanthus floridulus TaxID=154761 RepID=UPI00345ADD10